MEGQLDRAPVALVVHDRVRAGRSRVLESAPGDEFVESGEPAESTAGRGADVGRMHDFLHGTVPSVAGPVRPGLQDVHAPGGNDGQAHGTIIDLDKLYALLLSPAQLKFVDRPGRAVVIGQCRAVQVPVAPINVPCGIGQNLLEGFIHASRSSGWCGRFSA